MTNKVRLGSFDPKKGLDRGKPIIIEIFWYFFKIVFFLSAFPWPTKLKVLILKVFGAEIGKGISIKPRVNIHFPWKLYVGDDVWIGEEVFILNFEPVRIESNTCISQRAFLCGGNHDYQDPSFSYRNKPIVVREGAWVGAQVFIGPGLTINEYAVISAGSIVYKDMPASMVCAGNPCKPIKPRWHKEV